MSEILSHYSPHCAKCRDAVGRPRAGVPDEDLCLFHLRLALAEATRERDAQTEIARGVLRTAEELGADLATAERERDEAREERDETDQRASELLDALDMALEKKVPDVRALRGAAFQQFWAWQEVSGHIGRGTSLYGEVEACIEEAFRLGALSRARETEAGAVREAALRCVRAATTRDRDEAIADLSAALRSEKGESRAD